MTESVSFRQLLKDVFAGEETAAAPIVQEHTDGSVRVRRPRRLRSDRVPYPAEVRRGQSGHQGEVGSWLQTSLQSNRSAKKISECHGV